MVERTPPDLAFRAIAALFVVEDAVELDAAAVPVAEAAAF